MPNNNTTSYMQWFKEIVTAGLGIALVAIVLFFMYPSLTNSPPDIVNAKEIYVFLGGPVGVVLGYYFGRIPSEKATDNANRNANNARTERDAAVRNMIEATTNYDNRLNNAEKVLEEVKTELNKPSVKTGIATGQLSSLNARIDNEIAQIRDDRAKIAK